ASGRNTAPRRAARRREVPTALRVSLGSDDRRPDRDGRLQLPAAHGGNGIDRRDPGHARARRGGRRPQRREEGVPRRQPHRGHARSRDGGAGLMRTLLLRSGASPFVAPRFLFEAGTRDEPPGREGIAALTGGLLVEGGAGPRSYREILDALYPMATGIGV